MNGNLKLFVLLFSLVIVPELHAKRFLSQFCEFELPPKWECALEGTEWVCQSVNKGRKKEAIIILAAKVRGSQDSLDQYKAYLNSQKTFNLPGGKTQVSDPKYTKLSDINGHKWIDSLHLASEVPGFYTRYLATVKQNLGVAVTFSVAKDHYDSYKDLFDKIVATLRVFAQKQNGTDYVITEKDESLVGDDTPFIATDDQNFGLGQRKKGSGSAGGMGDDLILYLVGAAVLIFVVLKAKGKKKKGASGEKKKKPKKK